MKHKTKLSDFRFVKTGSGSYQVTYTSPVTGKQWSTQITCMMIIDATKNEDNPKRKDLDMLKWICKNAR